MRGSLLLSFCLLMGLPACDAPPPAAYYKSKSEAQGIAIGDNATGEACTMVTRSGGGADIFCGAWQQPSARIRTGGAAGEANLTALATNSPWRVELESRFACSDPRADAGTTVILQCSRRSGGWAQVALVTVAGDTVWLADGTPASYPTIQRAIAQLSGGIAVSTTAPNSAAMAEYLAARSFSAGDIAQYEGLMVAGLQANLAGKPEQAEKAYRAALALQEKAQGKDSPAGAAAMMSLALQLSVQGRFEDAQQFFARAERLINKPGAAQIDRNGVARLLLYTGLHALNLSDPKRAIDLFQRAEATYRAHVPEARELPVAGLRRANISGASAGGVAVGDALANSQPYATLTEKEALIGILEARRDRAIALRLSGNAQEAIAIGRSAERFAQANALTAPVYAARLYRTVGVNSAADEQIDAALSELGESVRAFRIAQPRTRPIAETQLAQAALLNRKGRIADALELCRGATALLKDTKDGVDFELMQPCLGIYAAAAATMGAEAEQPMLSEMFAASQLTRGSVTDQEIRRTAVRLAAGGADPRVSEAIRRQQDAERALSDLLRDRDAIGSAPADAASVAKAAELDKAIVAGRAALSDADGVVQAAAPNYQQLIQQAVRPEDVFASLRPGEAFVAITLAKSGGWTFVLRDGKIAVGPVGGGTEEIAALVRKVRKSIEPGDDDRVPAFDANAALALYTRTLAPVAAALEGAHVMTVAPTGPLLSLPFEVLLTGPVGTKDLNTAPFLVRKFVIAHVPAAANFVKLRQTAASRQVRPWLGFGDFRPITEAQAAKTYSGDRCKESAHILASLPRLDGTEVELDIASRIFGAAPADRVVGPAFTVPKVKAMNQTGALSQYRIIHFATHGLLPAELACQDEPAIVTSVPDGAKDAIGALLTSSEISSLKLDADAVILSACNSGGPGGTTAGESLAGLARSFFYAGARSLVVTHWTVDDSTATRLVSRTLLNYEKNHAQGLATALRNAQTQYLDDPKVDASLKHPYYWAPFTLVGEGGATGTNAQIPASTLSVAGL